MNTSWEVVVDSKKQKNKSRNNNGHGKLIIGGQSRLTDQQTHTFLSLFKTNPCPNIDGTHDPRICHGYHSDEKDRRRNPYQEYYELDDSLNQMEKMYHPILFRTTLCKRGASCTFGNKCAHAHTFEFLRNRNKATMDYEHLMYEPVVERQSLLSYVPDQALGIEEKRNFRQESVALWSECRVQHSVKRLRLLPHEYFVLDKSLGLKQEIDTFAFEEGLGFVETPFENKGRFYVQIRGLHVEAIAKRIAEVLKPPSRYFSWVERCFKDRIMKELMELLRSDAERSLLPNPEHNMIQVLEKGKGIRVTALNTNNNESNAQDNIREVFDKIDFWIRRQGYDKFVNCQCCLSEYNKDQGVFCSNDHFYCSEAGCFELAVSSQINNIRSRDKGLLCPNCNAEYSMKEIAPHLSPKAWQDIQDAIVDKRVEKQTAKLSKQFDERLAAKVEELLQAYGQESELIKQQAKSEAQKIRNTIINLCCPHCEVAYFDFTGCMALQCSTCNKNFCGYCHEKFATGYGTHEHVRQCLLNETNNGSYYANKEQIGNAQRRYRIRKLKLHIRQFKKNLQNAIVFELERDLNDLQINPQALFEFGHLQPELHADER